MTQDQKIVLVTGTFDIIHKGHRKFLADAKKLGDKLYVVIAKDETVKKVKGKLPLHNEEQRVQDMKLVPGVDKVFLGYLGDKYQIIEEIKPDIIALGYDQEAFVDKLEDELKKRNLNTKVQRLTSHFPEKYKSSKLKQLLPSNKEDHLDQK